MTKVHKRLQYKLNTTEIEMVRLASEGYTNNEIGTRIYWSEVQVKRKTQDIYLKLEVTNLCYNDLKKGWTNEPCLKNLYFVSG